MEGDLIFLHVSISDTEDDQLWSTLAAEEGSGSPLAFLLEKGVRVPRGWEIAVKGECLSWSRAVRS